MFLRCGDITIHVLESGPADAPPVILLHSIGVSSVIWETVAPRLATRFRVLAPDMRGHGLSSVTPGPYTMAQLARDAVGVLDALGIARAHLVGLSIGGLIAQAAALAAPDRFDRLVLAGTGLTLAPPSRWTERAALVRREGMAPLEEAVIARWVTPGFRDRPETEGLRNVFLRTPPEAYAGACEAIAAADFSTVAGGIRHPTLVMTGSADEATPPDLARALAAAIPGAQLRLIPDAPHIMPMETPEPVAAALLDFLAQ